MAKKKDNSSTPQVFFFFFQTQTQLPQWEKRQTECAFSSVFVRPFLTQARQRKSLGKSRWAKSVVTYEICSSRYEGKICHISPALDRKKKNRVRERMREAESRGRRAVEVFRGWIQWVAVRPPVGCQLALWFLYGLLPGEGEAGKLRLSRKHRPRTELKLTHEDCMWWCLVAWFQNVLSCRRQETYCAMHECIPAFTHATGEQKCH